MAKKNVTKLNSPVRTSEKYVIVGRSDMPSESTTTAPDVDSVVGLVTMFLPGGAMWRDGDKGCVSIYIPGTILPEDVFNNLPE